MRHRHHAFAWKRHSGHVDPVELVDRLSGTVQEAIDIALDSLFDVMDKVDVNPDDVRARAERFATSFASRWGERGEWRDDDDPAEAMR